MGVGDQFKRQTTRCFLNPASLQEEVFVSGQPCVSVSPLPALQPPIPLCQIFAFGALRITWGTEDL